MSVASGFDRLAPWYDGLVKLAFGREVYRAQVQWLDRIPAGARVLIIGGGTGWILSEVLRRSQASQVTYLEISEGMLVQTRQRMQREGWPLERYVLRRGSWQDLSEEETYEAVLTFFFLDLFKEAEVRNLMWALSQRVDKQGVWLFADFLPVNRGQRWLLQLMYAFFRRACGISGQQLLPYDRLFNELGWALQQEMHFAQKMIRSRWYQQ